jgi:hypothetical protein
MLIGLRELDLSRGQRQLIEVHLSIDFQRSIRGLID